MKTLILLLILSCSAWADSIQTFALQQPQGLAPSFQNQTNVLLGVGTPLLGPTLVTHYLTGNYLAFATLLGTASGPMELTLTIGGITYSTGALLNSAASCVNSFALPRNFYHPTAAVLTVNFNGEMETYGFKFVDPVPEPATLTLVGIGLCLVARRWRKS